MALTGFWWPVGVRQGATAGALQLRHCPMNAKDIVQGEYPSKSSPNAALPDAEGLERFQSVGTRTGEGNRYSRSRLFQDPPKDNQGS